MCEKPNTMSKLDGGHLVKVKWVVNGGFLVHHMKCHANAGALVAAPPKVQSPTSRGQVATCTQ